MNFLGHENFNMTVVDFLHMAAHYFMVDDFVLAENYLLFQEFVC